MDVNRTCALSLLLVDILANASMSLVKADRGVAGPDGADGDMSADKIQR